MSETSNTKESHTTDLFSFERYVDNLRGAMKRQYDRCINKDLSQQKWQDLFKRNVTAVLNQAYEDSLVQLKSSVLTVDTDEFRF